MPGRESAACTHEARGSLPCLFLTPPLYLGRVARTGLTLFQGLWPTAPPSRLREKPSLKQGRGHRGHHAVTWYQPESRTLDSLPKFSFFWPRFLFSKGPSEKKETKAGGRSRGRKDTPWPPRFLWILSKAWRKGSNETQREKSLHFPGNIVIKK